jgi:hypothetical protein
MVAPGGEALGGVIGVARHMIQTEGFFSLYKGLVPSLISMAPSGAVFYGMYDILKMAYLHSPEGKKRISMMKQQKQEANALDQLELGTVRTLLYGAIAGCCAEAATYPFEVVRRQLQMQVKANRLNAFATCLKIVDQGGVPALYAGLIPSLLQVCILSAENLLPHICRAQALLLYCHHFFIAPSILRSLQSYTVDYKFSLEVYNRLLQAQGRSKTSAKYDSVRITLVILSSKQYACIYLD